jgi:excinuclease ABC subunit C
VSLSQEIEQEDALYFGPFTSKRHLATTLEGLNRVFKLRMCSDATFQKYRFAPCIEYHVNQCSGPCAGLIPPERYQADVQDLIAFLEGRATNLVQRLVDHRDRLTEAMAFEEAGLVHQQMLNLLHLQSRSSMLVRAVHQNHCLILLPSGEPEVWRILLVLHGRPADHERFDPRTDSFDALAQWVLDARHRLVPENLPVGEESASLALQGRALIPKEAFEETRIIAQWLQLREPDDGIVLGLLSEASPQRLIAKLREKLFGADLAALSRPAPARGRRPLGISQ